MTAASQARRRRDADELEIVAFERGEHTSYSACGIPYFIAGDVGALDDLVARTPAEHRARDIDVHLRHEVVAIDLARRAVQVADLDGGTERWEPFDSLVYATGSVPMRPDLPGSDADGIFGVQTLDDGALIRRVLESDGADRPPPRRAVVVGGGYIGLEMAEALVKHGLDVTLIEAAAHPMSTLDPDVGALIADAIRGVGVTLYEGERVTGFGTDGGRGGGHVTSVATAEREVPAEIVLLGLGSRPNVALARDAGIPLGTSGGVAVDRRMQTQVAAVWAAGDCVESFHRVSRTPVVIALGTHANKQGRVAGINIGGGYAAFHGVVGTAVSKICEYEVARTGLNEREAAAAGFQYVTAEFEGTTRAGYFPGTMPIRIKMLAERRTGRLLGAQIVGREGAAKRIDVIALALWNEMTVEDLLGTDLSYAPPFSPVWDPVLVAARRTFEAVEGGPA
jgi:NADPH-dependent 2,4-dienoyl-CoA reductase/sulfur reductase-like enzyme